MRRSILFKAIAVLLCALSLLAVVGSACAMVLLGSYSLYTQTPEEYRTDALEGTAMQIAQFVATRYNARNLDLRPQELQNNYEFDSYRMENYEYFSFQETEGLIQYAIYATDGTLLESTFREKETLDSTPYSVITGSTYCIVTQLVEEGGTAAPDLPSSEEEIPTTQPSVPSDGEAQAAAALPEADGTYLYAEIREISTEAGTRVYQLRFFSGPDYRVSVWLAPGVWWKDSSGSWQLANSLYLYRYALIGVLLAGLGVLFGTAVYLGWASGRRPGRDVIQAGGLNRIPLDLYLLGGGTCVSLLVMLALFLLLDVAAQDPGNPTWIFFSGIPALFAALICVGFYCAGAAQVKMPNGYWWRHSVIGWCLRKTGNFFRTLGRGLGHLFSMLPLIWQWLLIGGAMGLLLILSDGFGLFLAILLSGAVLCYGAYCFGTLYDGVKRMARGDLTKTVSIRHLHGCFLDAANQLNALADVAVVAANKQMKSERMKTELITNVSHDIKTPLTSIINYVDLLRKPHSQQQEADYLDVLFRQSQRMKKLIEDLVEMSKASTGNLQAEIQIVDAAEAVNQALGEFSDKLAAANLTPIFPQPEQPMQMMADGRLAWRVLSNVLSNVVKYALPGTRIYVDIARLEDHVIISLKNISREQLNISAEELMERFVRGDAARNTEGSGLGLNIAQSLMEIQHGKLQLLVDGDLFKVTLIFPGA